MRLIILLLLSLYSSGDLIAVEDYSPASHELFKPVLHLDPLGDPLAYNYSVCYVAFGRSSTTSNTRVNFPPRCPDSGQDIARSYDFVFVLSPEKPEPSKEAMYSLLMYDRYWRDKAKINVKELGAIAVDFGDHLSNFASSMHSSSSWGDAVTLYWSSICKPFDFLNCLNFIKRLGFQKKRQKNLVVPSVLEKHTASPQSSVSFLVDVENFENAVGMQLDDPCDDSLLVPIVQSEYNFHLVTNKSTELARKCEHIWRLAGITVRSPSLIHVSPISGEVDPDAYVAMYHPDDLYSVADNIFNHGRFIGQIGHIKDGLYGKMLPDDRHKDTGIITINITLSVCSVAAMLRWHNGQWVLTEPDSLPYCPNMAAAEEAGQVLPSSRMFSTRNALLTGAAMPPISARHVVASLRHIALFGAEAMAIEAAELALQPQRFLAAMDPYMDSSEDDKRAPESSQSLVKLVEDCLKNTPIKNSRIRSPVDRIQLLSYHPLLAIYLPLFTNRVLPHMLELDIELPAMKTPQFIHMLDDVRVRVFGWHKSASSLGNDCRGIVRQLISRGITVEAIEYQAISDNLANVNHQQRLAPYECIDDMENMSTEHSSINIFTANHQTVKNFFSYANPLMWAHSYNVVLVAYEFSEIPSSIVTLMQYADEIFTISDFVKEAIHRSLPYDCPLPVTVINTNPQTPDVNILNYGNEGFCDERGYCGYETQTNFLFAFDCYSTLERKNPIGLIEAFQRAFPLNSTNSNSAQVFLTFKCSNCESYHSIIIKQKRWDSLELLEQFYSLADADTRILVVERFLSDEEMSQLKQTASAFVSLHRAEGYGWNLVESMALGVPVVTPNYSGPLDYITNDTAYIVPYSMVPVFGPQAERSILWAEPHQKAVVDTLRWIAQNRDEARERGARAKYAIRKQLSFERHSKRLAERIRWICKYGSESALSVLDYWRQVGAYRVEDGLVYSRGGAHRCVACLEHYNQAKEDGGEENKRKLDEDTSGVNGILVCVEEEVMQYLVQEVVRALASAPADTYVKSLTDVDGYGKDEQQDVSEEYANPKESNAENKYREERENKMMDVERVRVGRCNGELVRQARILGKAVVLVKRESKHDAVVATLYRREVIGNFGEEVNLPEEVGLKEMNVAQEEKVEENSVDGCQTDGHEEVQDNEVTNWVQKIDSSALEELCEAWQQTNALKQYAHLVLDLDDLVRRHSADVSERQYEQIRRLAEMINVEVVSKQCVACVLGGVEWTDDQRYDALGIGEWQRYLDRGDSDEVRERMETEMSEAIVRCMGH